MCQAGILDSLTDTEFDHNEKWPQPILNPTSLLPKGVTYNESNQFTNLGGFLMFYGEQGVVTMSASLSDEEKMVGIKYLVNCLERTSQETAGVYLWTIANKEEGE